MSKIILYNPPSPWLISDTVELPLGLLYLASWIRKEEHQVEIIDLSNNGEMKVPKADFYGIGFTSPQYIYALKVKEKIQKYYPDAKIIVGGPHATSLPTEMIHQGFSAVVRGEGERSISDILSNGITKEIYELDYVDKISDLPFPAWDLINMENYVTNTNVFSYIKQKDPTREINMMGSRGCTGKCAYCTKFKGPIRQRSVESIILEIETLKSVYGVNRILFSDDNLVLNKIFLKKLCDELYKTNIPWRCLGRTDQIDEMTCKYMVDHGCVGIDFGIETGSQKLLDLVQKNITVEEQENGLRIAHKAGLQVRAQMMVGFPQEDNNDHKKNKEFIQRNIPFVSKWGIHLFIPFPTCDIWINSDKYRYKIDKNTNFANFQTIGKPHEWNYKTKEGDDIVKIHLKELLETAGKKNIFIEE